MKTPKLILISLITLGIGGLSGWALRPIVRGNSPGAAPGASGAGDGQSVDGISRTDDFRVRLLASTGLQLAVEPLKAEDARSVCVAWHRDSNNEAVKVLHSLLDLEGIDGCDLTADGVKRPQVIAVEGELLSEVLETTAAPNEAGPDKYQRFKVRSLKVGFPLWRSVRTGDGEDFEVHHGFETLFPKGLTIEGSEIDLSKYSKMTEE